MSVRTRREYLEFKRKEYQQARSRQEKSRILDEVCRNCDYHRKYAIQVLNGRAGPSEPADKRRRRRRKQYQEALPVIQVVWEALDYPCAERLHPVLLPTAELLAAHGEVTLTPLIRQQLAAISRSTLARRLAELPSPKPRRSVPRPKARTLLHQQVPIGRFDWDEDRPGALEVDLLEHNGGSTAGHYAYTLSVVDIVTGWSRRRAILGLSQKAVHSALAHILDEWPFPPWALHTDNGAEFLNSFLLRFVEDRGLVFHRSRPYRKNDSPHVEQRNRQFVREVVGYARYDTPEHVAWLNEVYAWLDLYANLFLPTRKVVAKTREGSRVIKRYDQAATPFQRLLALAVLPHGRDAGYDIPLVGPSDIPRPRIERSCLATTSLYSGVVTRSTIG